MIASLRGRVGSRTGGSVILDVGGVGYLVTVSAPTMASLGDVGAEASVLVHTQVRDDAITLFGFRDSDEREVFLMLVGVQGVGSRIALALLSALSPDGVLAALAGGDRRSLCAAPGVGPKLAARLCSELAGKAVSAGAGGAAAPAPGGSAWDDARAALTGQLGFQRMEAEQMLSAARSVPNPPSDTGSIISACLRIAHAKAA